MIDNNIRNFCIIAHIDHGKSTLADRLLELTNTIAKRAMKEQILDDMDIERERGITIKLRPVRMLYKNYILNLIDTPGHVDFSYEVSRSLAAVEGALLVVDATQGIQAQTLANLHLAIEENLEIIPVINKIDLKQADVEGTKKDIIKILGCKDEEIISISAKTGEEVDKVLQAVIDKIPPPQKTSSAKLQAMIFDSSYDDFRGVIAYVRMFNGKIKNNSKITFLSNNKQSTVIEVGHFTPKLKPTENLIAGEIGYIVTGLKDISSVNVGDTITLAGDPTKPLKGYREVKPMVYAGIFCQEGSDFEELREAIEKLKLNDSSLVYQPESSKSLGFGFRCGFLGVLHLEIFQERLSREFDLDLIITPPSVAYKIIFFDGSEASIKNPQDFPDENKIKEVYEPQMSVEIVTPRNYQGAIMQYVQAQDGVYQNIEYLDSQRCILKYLMPLSSIIIDFYDKIKSVSSGYASLNYEFNGYQKVEIAKLDILIAEKKQDSLSILINKKKVYENARRIVDSLKDVIPRKLFEIKIQAAIGSKVIASSRIAPLRKDVIAKLYGGDVTRKRKLLEKQKRGKKRMQKTGSIDIPAEAYLAVFKKSD